MRYNHQLQLAVPVLRDLTTLSARPTFSQCVHCAAAHHRKSRLEWVSFSQQLRRWVLKIRILVVSCHIIVLRRRWFSIWEAAFSSASFVRDARRLSISQSKHFQILSSLNLFQPCQQSIHSSRWTPVPQTLSPSSTPLQHHSIWWRPPRLYFSSPDFPN